MTLLAPISAIIAGAIAFPAILLFYFLKLRRRPLKVGSTMLWQRAVEDLQVNEPFRWLRASWILLVQLLALALLVLAIGRPAIEGSAGTGERLVILLDRSASMSARDADDRGTTRFEAARTRARELIAERRRSAGSAGPVALVVFARDAHARTPFTTEWGRLERALDAATPTDEPADLAGAVSLVTSLLVTDAADEGERAPARVVLLSDGSFEQPTGHALPDARVELATLGPAAPVETTLRANPEAGMDEVAGGGTETRDQSAQTEPNEPPFDNVGIVSLSAKRDYDDPSLVRIFARLLSAGGNRTVPISLTIDGVVTERRAVTLEPRAPGEPPQAPVTFEFSRTEPAIVTLRIGGSDALPSDNEASLVLREAATPRIVLVTPDAGDDRSSVAWVLSIVLQELSPGRTRVVSPGAFLAQADTIASEADLIVFDRVDATRLPPVPSIHFGASVPGLPTIAPRDAPGGVPARILSWRRSHPILRDSTLDRIEIVRWAPLELPEAEPEAGESNQQITPLDDEPEEASEADQSGAGVQAARSLAWSRLARGPDGPIMALATQADGTRRLALGFSPAQSTWPIDAGFPVFIAAAVEHLTLSGDARAGEFTTTGEPARVLFPPGVEQAEFNPVEEGPPSLLATRRGDTRGPGPALTAPVERAGLYLEPTLGLAIASNVLNATETLLRTDQSLNIASDTTLTRDDAGGVPNELWWWFVLAAFSVLSIEWIAYAWSMRV